jgi:hypothetical protein
MAKYLLLPGGTDLDKRTGNPDLAPQLFQQFATWISGLRERGHFVGAHKLQDRTGARLSVRGGQIVEGPFIETKEAIGGAFLIEAGSLAEAVELARGCPTLLAQNGYVEVRVVEEPRIPASG